MLGLTRTDEVRAVVCESDPAIGGDGDTWREPANGESKRATVVQIRALSTLELVRVLPGLRAIEAEGVAPAAILEAFLPVCRAGFVGLTEGDSSTEDPATLEHMSIGQVVALGTLILSESQGPTDPTGASGSA